MRCSKIGGECPHTAMPDNKLVFVMMPFEDSKSLYDQIETAVESTGKGFKCERADDKYTNLSIWCDRICKNIRKSKYLIVDTSDKNPNVFYELGFSHALQNTKAIIITQNVQNAPFDIKDLNHIVYSENDFPAMREKIKNAILTLEEKEEEESYINKTPEEVIKELKNQLRTEEERTAKFKKDLIETEEREKKLKEHIKEIESIQRNPVKEAENNIIKIEGTIAEMRTKLKYTEDDAQDRIQQLTRDLKEKEEKLKTLEDKFQNYKESNDEKPLSDLLLDDAKKRSEARTWFRKGINAYDIGEYERAVEYYSTVIELDPQDSIAYNNRGSSYYKLGQYKKSIEDCNKIIELDPKNSTAYSNRGLSYYELGQYEKSIEDCNKAIELDPQDSSAYNNRGLIYYELGQFERSIEDYHKAIELDPNYELAYLNAAEVSIITGAYNDALELVEKPLSSPVDTEDRAIASYLKNVAKKLLKMSTLECEAEFEKILKISFTITWSFDTLDSWIEGADFPEEIKKFIIEKTNLLKKHKNL